MGTTKGSHPLTRKEQVAWAALGTLVGLILILLGIGLVGVIL